MDKGVFVESKRREFEEDIRTKRIKFEQWLSTEVNRRFPEIRYSHALSVKEVFLTILSFLNPLDVYRLRIALGHERAMKLYYKKDLSWPGCYLAYKETHQCKYPTCTKCNLNNEIRIPECAFLDHINICSFCGNVCCKNAGGQIVVAFDGNKGREYYACAECYRNDVWAPPGKYHPNLTTVRRQFGRNVFCYTTRENIDVDSIAIYDAPAKARNIKTIFRDNKN